jgi:hypothetical protein
MILCILTIFGLWILIFGCASMAMSMPIIIPASLGSLVLLLFFIISGGILIIFIYIIFLPLYYIFEFIGYYILYGLIGYAYAIVFSPIIIIIAVILSILSPLVCPILSFIIIFLCCMSPIICGIPTTSCLIALLSPTNPLIGPLWATIFGCCLCFSYPMLCAASPCIIPLVCVSPVLCVIYLPCETMLMLPFIIFILCRNICEWFLCIIEYCFVLLEMTCAATIASIGATI